MSEHLPTGRTLRVDAEKAADYMRRQERTRALALYIVGASGRRPERARAALKREQERKERARG